MARTVTSRKAQAEAERREAAAAAALAARNEIRRRLRAETQISPGSAGDHPSVHQLLTAVFHGPSREAFYASLEDPFYEPRHRLVAKRGAQVISHVQITKRVMGFGPLQLPVDGLADVATFPEYRDAGFARRLVTLAERMMSEDGAVLGTLSTRIPHFFRRSGWAVCGRYSHARAGARELLAQLSARGAMGPKAATLRIRPWRQVELPALLRLYANNSQMHAGHFERTEQYWRWLVARGGFERLFVAIEGPDRLDVSGSFDSIVGYMITKEDHVLELVSAPEKRHVADALLARACGEAIERDAHAVTLHAPPHDPHFELFRAARGTVHCHETWQGQVQMMRLIDLPRFLRLLRPELMRRAREAGLPARSELGLEVDDARYRLVVTRRGIKLSRKQLGRRYLTLNRAELTRLCLGHQDVDEAIGQGRIVPSTQTAAQTAKALFPPVAMWRPPLEELWL